MSSEEEPEPEEEESIKSPISMEEGDLTNTSMEMEESQDEIGQMEGGDDAMLDLGVSLE